MFTGYQILKKLKGNLNITQDAGGSVQLSDLDGNVILPGMRVLNYADTYNISKQATEGNKVKSLTINNENYTDRDTYTYLPTDTLDVNVKLEIKQLEMFNITTNLTRCTINNAATQAFEDTSYTATLTAETDYTLREVTVTMGGVNITSTNYSAGVIHIDKVIGNIEITAIARDVNEPEVTITPISNTSFEYTIFDNIGVTGYAITRTADEPTEWITEGDLNQGAVDILEAGTYYVWAKDLAENIIHNSITAYSITTNLTDCIIDSELPDFTLPTTINVNINHSNRFKVTSLNVLVGGNQVTTSVSDLNFDINVTGNVEITSVATELQSGLYQNGVLKYTWAELEARSPIAFEAKGLIKQTDTFSSAFYGLSGDVIIDNSIYILEYGAFYNSNLTSITFPNHYVHIASSQPFYSCDNLKKLYLPDNGVVYTFISRLSDEAPLLEYNTYKNGRYLGNNLNPYMLLHSLVDTTVTEFEMHPDCKQTGEKVFANCSNLVNLYLSDNLEFMDSYSTDYSGNAFIKSTSLNFNIYNGCKYLGTKTNPYHLLVCPENKSLTSVSIHSNTKMLNNHAFDTCSSLVSVSAPNGLLHIGWDCFADDKKLTSFNMPSTVRSICDDAFAGVGLKSINLPEGLLHLGGGYCRVSSVTSIRLPNSLVYTDSLGWQTWSVTNITLTDSLLYCGGSISYESAITSIHIPKNLYLNPGASYTIEGNSKLQTITVDPENKFYSDMGCNVFYYKDTSTVVVGAINSVIPEGTLSIGNDAFYKSGIRNLIIPDSVTYLGSFNFSYCYNLTRLEIGSGISTLSSNLWSYDTNPKMTIKFKRTTPPTISASGSITKNLSRLLVPAASINAYRTATNWTNYASYLVGYETFTAGASLPNYADGTTYTTTTWYSDEACTTQVTSFTTDGEYYCKLS